MTHAEFVEELKRTERLPPILAAGYALTIYGAMVVAEAGPETAIPFLAKAVKRIAVLRGQLNELQAYFLLQTIVKMPVSAYADDAVKLMELGLDFEERSPVRDLTQCIKINVAKGE